MNNSPPLSDWFQVACHYDQRFAQAEANRQQLHPLQAPAIIRQQVKSVLGASHIPQPEITVRKSRSQTLDGVEVHALSGQSWPGCEVTALYFETSDTGPRPTVVICCGHGAEGKHTPSYFNLALLLARQGANVLIPDNLGQGERMPMGHRQVFRPFTAGFTFQGMIVKETMAWIDWLEKQPTVDPGKLAASGNSGGGTLTLFLAALEPRLKLLTSSGYPSTFSYIARKEKFLCACNILTGAVPLVDMWQIYGLFAPKPLFLFQGIEDRLFPPDIFNRVANRVEAIYREADGDNHTFESLLSDGGHSWDEQRLRAMGDFYARHWNLRPQSDFSVCADQLPEGAPYCHDLWPDDALDSNTVAAHIAGVDPASSVPPFEELFPSPIAPELRDQKWGRSTFGLITAQYECFLAGCRALPDRRQPARQSFHSPHR